MRLQNIRYTLIQTDLYLFSRTSSRLHRNSQHTTALTSAIVWCDLMLIEPKAGLFSSFYSSTRTNVTALWQCMLCAGSSERKRAVSSSNASIIWCIWDQSAPVLYVVIACHATTRFSPQSRMSEPNLGTRCWKSSSSRTNFYVSTRTGLGSLY